MIWIYPSSGFPNQKMSCHPGGDDCILGAVAGDFFICCKGLGWSGSQLLFIGDKLITPSRKGSHIIGICKPLYYLVDEPCLP